MKTLCPICSDILLRHVDRSRISWFCLRCYQEVPNFNLIKFNTIQKRIRQSDYNLNHRENTTVKTPIDSIYQSIEYQSTTIDLLIDRNKIRLEVIGFIMNKIDLLLVDILANYQSPKCNLEHESKPDRYQKHKVSGFIKAKFLRDSEVILLYICQAILVADSSILDKVIREELTNNCVDSKFQIEKTYLIDSIKTLAIDFIKTIYQDSSQNIDCFVSEISSYFDTVVSLMIRSSVKTNSFLN